MKTALARATAALALMTIAACSSVDTPADEASPGDVPAELADKVKSGCPDLIKPEPVAIITRGFEVAEVARGPVNDICTVSVQDGRQVLSVGLIGYPSKELAEQYVDMQCPGNGFEGPDQSCKVTTRDGENFKVHGVAGRWEVKISVF